MLNDLPLTLIDVGALGGMQGKWQSLTNVQFVGFEPDQRKEPPVTSVANRKIFSVGVAKENGDYPIYLTREPCNSSLLKPNLSVIKSLAYDEKDFDIVQTALVHCKNLDQICLDGALDPDALKLDTQGSEYEILQGAHSTIKRLLAVEIEVEFLQLYEGQKLFSDIDIFMQANGFMLMDIGNQLYMKGRPSRDFNLRKGYLVAADALYFRTHESLLEMSSNCTKEKLLSLLPICYTYGYLNFAYDFFSRLKSVHPEKYQCFDRDINCDPMLLIRENLPAKKTFTISERKYSLFRNFIEKRIKKKNSNWNYGLGNPT